MVTGRRIEKSGKDIISPAGQWTDPLDEPSIHQLFEVPRGGGNGSSGQLDILLTGDSAMGFQMLEKLNLP